MGKDLAEGDDLLLGRKSFSSLRTTVCLTHDGEQRADGIRKCSLSIQAEARMVTSAAGEQCANVMEIWDDSDIISPMQ